MSGTRSPTLRRLHPFRPNLDGILHVICPSDEKSVSKNSFQTSVSKNYLRIEKIAAHSKASPMGSRRQNQRLADWLPSLHAAPLVRLCSPRSSSAAPLHLGNLHRQAAHLPTPTARCSLERRSGSISLVVAGLRAAAPWNTADSDMVCSHVLAQHRCLGGRGRPFRAAHLKHCL